MFLTMEDIETSIIEVLGDAATVAEFDRGNNISY